MPYQHLLYLLLHIDKYSQLKQSMEFDCALNREAKITVHTYLFNSQIAFEPLMELAFVIKHLPNAHSPVNMEMDVFGVYLAFVLRKIQWVNRKYTERKFTRKLS